MRVGAALVLVTALMIFIQLVTGGMFLIVNEAGDAHVILGYVTILVALAAGVAAWVSKPVYNAIRYSSLTLFALVLLSGFLSEKVNLLAHYDVSVIVFGASVAGTFYAVRWNRMPTTEPGPTHGVSRPEHGDLGALLIILKHTLHGVTERRNLKEPKSGLFHRSGHTNSARK